MHLHMSFFLCNFAPETKYYIYYEKYLLIFIGHSGSVLAYFL